MAVFAKEAFVFVQQDILEITVRVYQVSILYTIKANVNRLFLGNP